MALTQYSAAQELTRFNDWAWNNMEQNVQMAWDF